MVAYPSYVDTVIRSHRSAARAALTGLVARQEAYFTQYKQYAGTITALGFPSSPTGLQSDGGLVDLDATPSPSDLVYKLQVSSASNTNYKVEAVPAGLQTKDNDCKTLFITATGTHGSTGGGNCW
ncbi:MAG: type IV pilin protein [Salinisphaera sp.]|nr:type IV pilin protein [Salinisphaera sp.]